MTDYEALVKAERKAADLAYYFGATDLHEEYEKAQADTDAALVALVAERDALRAQLDGMTVERTTVPQFVTDKDTGDNRLDLLPRPRGHFEFPLMKRLVGPWTAGEDSEGVSDGQQ
jgi:hypothetical protein